MGSAVAGGSSFGKGEQLVVSLWSRFLASLVDSALNNNGSWPPDEDVPLEHLLTLLLLYHSLPALQHKKPVLLNLATEVVRLARGLRGVAPLSNQLPPLLATRLLLVLNYMLAHYYEPPSELVSQVQTLLFGQTSGAAMLNSSGHQLVMVELEDTLAAVIKTQEEASRNKKTSAKNFNFMRPLFYDLAPNFDAIKCDGLAISSLLGMQSENCSYDALFNAVLSLTELGSWKVVTADSSDSDLHHTLSACAARYHHVICWRLLHALPPSLGLSRSSLRRHTFRSRWC